ncbi:MAG: prepilin-type N-terminal cleavage/methylation domain-containing protein [Gammaproteobacteria bacterium]|nr:prepilin-type N-terminal cleavage/methylation domain-containing protein [Gammaproteobacteria bacterium]
MNRAKGFTLIEWLLVIILIGIVGATASPLLQHHQIFQERFFINDLSSMLRYAHKVATMTGCEVKISYNDRHELSLSQRQSCSGDFTQKVISPYLMSENRDYVVSIPRSIVLNANLPIYIDGDGKVYDQSHQWKKKLILQIKQQQLIIDGTTGFVYEKS